MIFFVRLLVIVLVTCSTLSCLHQDKVELPIQSSNALFFIVAGNSDLSKDAEEKVTAILDAPAISSTVYLLKGTRLHDEFVLLRKQSGFVDTVFRANRDPIYAISKACNYIGSQSYTNINGIIFSHASGWFPLGSKFRYALIDDYNKISTAELFNSLRPLRFRNLVFESCNMGAIEDIFEFHKICDYYVSSTSEMLSPGFTPIYKRYGLELLENYQTLVLGFIKEFSYHYTSLLSPRNSHTISVINSKSISFLFPMLKQIIKRLHIDDHTYVQTLNMEGENTIFDLLSLVKASELEIEMKQQIEKAINDAVLFAHNSKDFLLNYGGFSIKTYCGIGISLSERLPRNGYWRQYYDNTGWGKYIKS